MQLTKGVFGSEFGPRVETPFGLRTGQMRSGGKLTHNSGWYSAAGDKLGWGDLSVSDFRKIQSCLEEGQVFVVLSEQDSFWNFVRNVGMLGSLCTTEPTVEAPGRAYLGAHAKYVITPTEFLYVDDWGYGSLTKDFDGLSFRVITAEERTKLFA